MGLAAEIMRAVLVFPIHVKLEVPGLATGGSEEIPNEKIPTNALLSETLKVQLDDLSGVRKRQARQDEVQTSAGNV